MALTKAQIINSISNNLNLPQIKSTELAESIFETLKSTLENGENVLLSGFGKFYVKEKNERMGRNPATGDDLMLDSRRVVRFSCSPVLRDKMNRKG